MKGDICCEPIPLSCKTKHSSKICTIQESKWVREKSIERKNERENEIERGKMSAKGGNHMIKQKVTDC